MLIWLPAPLDAPLVSFSASDSPIFLELVGWSVILGQSPRFMTQHYKPAVDNNVRYNTERLIFRLSQTLSHVRKLHWIVVEDGDRRAPAVNWILRRSGLPFVYLVTLSAEGMPRRGWTHRNLALQYVRENYDENANAVIYFADDDNSYDIRLFNNYIRNVKRIGVWAIRVTHTIRRYNRGIYTKIINDSTYMCKILADTDRRLVCSALRHPRNDHR
ncbi:glycosyltransferase family 43 [Oesophagostomum dentatum]|uniref:Galactosylgalactosylxylosylprotein 3-beta-glucuronosyltransferase n=1 Tax=Oesophagostomum dentatum TaxID=61180 RepID=A0A0B1TAY9_OESDE|nr:glycosyltransferase family 43 [Oesophagostomum dentatum]